MRTAMTSQTHLDWRTHPSRQLADLALPLRRLQRKLTKM